MAVLLRHKGLVFLLPHIGLCPSRRGFPMQLFSDLFSNVLNFTWQQGLMILIEIGRAHV